MDLVNFKPSNTSIQLTIHESKKVDSPSSRSQSNNKRDEKKLDMLIDIQEKNTTQSLPLNEILDCKKELNTRTGKEVTFEIADGIAKVNDTILDDLSSILVSFEISQINSTFKFQGTLYQDTQFLKSMLSKMVTGFSEVRSDEGVDLQDYKRMLELGVPPDVVQTAMKRNDCSDNEIEKLFKGMNIHAKKNDGQQKVTSPSVLPLAYKFERCQAKKCRHITKRNAEHA